MVYWRSPADLLGLPGGLLVVSWWAPGGSKVICGWSPAGGRDRPCRCGRRHGPGKSW